MALIEDGRVCVKKNGRDAGDRAVVTKVVDGNFVMIMSSTRPRDRKCNVAHLEFLSEKVDLKDKEQVAKVLEIDKAKLGSPANKQAPPQQKPQVKAAPQKTAPVQPKK